MAYLWLVTCVLLAVSGITQSQQGQVDACMRYIAKARMIYCGNVSDVLPTNEVNLVRNQTTERSEAERRKHEADVISACCLKPCYINEIFNYC